jgi:uncharacterized protein (TIGR03435 family)
VVWFAFSMAMKLARMIAGMAAVILPIALAVCHKPLLLAQTQSATEGVKAVGVPGFEVASVKRCTDGVGAAGRSGGGLTSSPGGISLACATLADLIHIAYDQNADKRPVNASMSDLAQPMKGGPSWINSERYDIDAKAGGALNRRTMLGPMLQALLEERFQLKVHVETEEVNVYELTVAKGGIKLQRLEEGGCIPIGSPKVASQPSGSPKPRCGAVHYGKSGTNKTLDVIGMSVSGFSGLLRNFLDRPIIDKTGIAGLFTFHLEYVPDEFTSGLYSGADNPDGAPAGTTSTPPTGPSILGALQQQLGLKLEKTKGPHGFLVIDHVEKPSEN